MRRSRVLPLLAITLMALSVPLGASASASTPQSGSAGACTASTFQDLSVAGATTVGAQASYEPTGTIQLTPLPPKTMPTTPFCEVQITLTHGALRGLPADIEHVWVWLPDSWNGNFEAIGGGGWLATNGARAMAPPLAAGYAVGSSDAGLPTASVNDPMLVGGKFDWTLFDNFAYRSVNETAVIAKGAIAAYYNHLAGYSYWNGCSNGGRQGLVAAERYPTDFNGILAQSPAIDGPAELNMSDSWPTFLEQAAYGGLMPGCKLAAMNKAVVAACDSQDGLADGLISDPQACDYRTPLEQLAGASTPCGVISQQDVDLMLQMIAGAKTPQGRLVGYGWAPGVDLSTGVGVVPNGAALQTFAAMDASWDWTTSTPAELTTTLYREMDKPALRVLATNSPDLHKFEAAGGKLIMWHGLADSIVPYQQTVQFYEDVARISGKGTASFARLFLAPGVSHCGGGYGPAPADPFGALVSWVQQGNAPGSLLAVQTDSAGNVTRSRPLCAYPKVAVYAGTGDPNSASSFDCRSSFTDS